MSGNFTKAICLLLCTLLLLAGCGTHNASPGREEGKKQKAYDDSLIEEIICEGEYVGNNEDTPIAYVYHIPQIKDDTEDARRLNESLISIRSDLEGENFFYEYMGWESHWNDSLLSLVVKVRDAYLCEDDYFTYHYDFAAGRSLTQTEFLNHLGITAEQAKSDLIRAAARRFDEDAIKISDIYGESFGSLLELRAQTIGESNLDLETTKFYLDDLNKLHAYILIGTLAGGGTYAAELCLERTPPKGVCKTAKCDFMTAKLKNNTVTLTFADTGTAGSFLPRGRVKFGVPYLVAGLYGEYTDLALGFMGNGGYAYLFLTDTEGRVTFCDIMSCLDCGSRFFAVGPLQAPQGVESYVLEKDAGGYYIHAVTGDGQPIDLYDAVSSAGNTIRFILRDKTWQTQDGVFSLDISASSVPSWSGRSGVLAVGEPLVYLGMTEKGLHYSVTFHLDDGSQACCVLTSECRTPYIAPEGETVLTLTQFAGPRLPGLPSGTGAKLHQKSSD